MSKTTIVLFCHVHARLMEKLVHVSHVKQGHSEIMDKCTCMWVLNLEYVTFEMTMNANEAFCACAVCNFSLIQFCLTGTFNLPLVA